MAKYACYFFSFSMEAIIILHYCSSLFTPKHKVKNRLSLLSILYLALFIASLFELPWLNIYLYFGANFIFMISEYNIKCLPALFHTAIIEAIMGMCELLPYSIISRFIPHFLQKEDFHNHLHFPFALLSKVSFFIIIYILTLLLKNRPKYTQQYNKAMSLLFIIPITSIFAMHTFISVGEYTSLSPTLNWMVALSTIFLLTSNILVFGINQYTQKKNREFTEMQLLLQKESDAAEYYKMLVTQHENQSILIHDIKKHLQSIDMLNQQRDHDKISAYIHQLMLSSDLKEMGRLCDHDLLNAVLSRYKRQCNNDYIDLQVDVRSKTTTFMEDSDLTSLFCNLLDNSVEAAHGIQDAFIELSVRKLENSPYIVLTVINSCRMNPFAEKNGVLATTKTDKLHHGFGLKSIRKIVSKYQGEFQQYFDDRTATFHTIITLKYT